jgi:hypothetical protein
MREIRRKGETGQEDERNKEKRPKQDDKLKSYYVGLISVLMLGKHSMRESGRDVPTADHNVFSAVLVRQLLQHVS